ncbi:hypothetical protein GCM10009803_23530 [Microbacterium ginsengiterrae]
MNATKAMTITAEGQNTHLCTADPRAAGTAADAPVGDPAAAAVSWIWSSPDELMGQR